MHDLYFLVFQEKKLDTKTYGCVYFRTEGVQITFQNIKTTSIIVVSFRCGDEHSEGLEIQLIYLLMTTGRYD